MAERRSQKRQDTGCPMGSRRRAVQRHGCDSEKRVNIPCCGIVAMIEGVALREEIFSVGSVERESSRRMVKAVRGSCRTRWVKSPELRLRAPEAEIFRSE